jgi:hypothetical protein
MSSTSARYGSRQDRGNDASPSSPRFNLPDSYWSNHSSQLRSELIINLPSQSLVKGIVAESSVASYQVRNDLLETTCQALLRQSNNRPDFSLSPDTLARLVVLKDPDGVTAQCQASISSTATAAATAVQQETAASGCCIPPACTIL